MLINTLDLINITFILIFVSGSISAGSGYLLVLFLVIFYTASRKKIHNSGLSRFYIFISLYSTILFFLTLNNPILSIKELSKLYSLAILMVCFNSLTTESRNKIFYACFTLVLISLATFNIDEVGRLKGFFIHANHLAYVCILLTCYAIIFIESKYLIIIIALLMVTTIATQSSGGLITLLYSIVGSFIIKTKMKVGLVLWVTTFLCALIFLGFEFGLLEPIIQKLIAFNWDTIQKKSIKLSFGASGSFVWRISYAHAILDNFFSQPLFNVIFGEGLGTQSSNNYIYSFMIKDPHNDYVRLLVERGVAGLLFVIFSFHYFCRKIKHYPFFLGLIAIPMLSGNVIVSFPFIFLYGLLISTRTEQTKDQLCVK